MSTATTVDTIIQPARHSGETICKEIKEIWRENFELSDEWLDMYFSKVYRQADLMQITDAAGDGIISTLLLQRYMMYFHSTPIPVGYVSGAATRKEYREKGYMKRLMQEAMEAAYDRGDILLTLIPASKHLYFYYDKLGFSTVFYADEERYTEKHTFEYTGRYEAMRPEGNHDVFQFVDEMLRKRDNVVLHDYNDLQNILADARLDNGTASALYDYVTGEITAFFIAVPEEDSVVVKELLSRDDNARAAALARVKALYPGRQIIVLSPADSNSVPMHARGMARIVNARRLLSAYAARYPKLQLSVKLYDPMMPQNNHIYIIDRGIAIINDGFGGKIDLDVTQEVLLSILCSDAPIGEIFELPTARPYMSMMLD